MRDINFFASYQGKSNNEKDKKKYLYFSAAALVLIIVGSFLWNVISLQVVKSQISQYNEELNDESLNEKLLEAKAVATKQKVFSKYNDEITEVIKSVESRQVVKSQLINELSSTLPSDVSFNSINISNGEVTIQAESSTREAIAELQHNLKELSNIEYVYIGAISGEDTFNFDIKCYLKDGE